MKEKIQKNILITLDIIIITLAAICIFVIFQKENKEKKLPKPEIASGVRGTFGIDKNIDETTIDDYLNRTDSVYRDVRMLKDPGNYETIGGDSYLSGFIKGFEIIPYPYLVNVTGLPESVGESYTGNTLFTQTEEGKYIANYEESMKILEELFPKYKNIFLVCGGGGFAGMSKNMLISLGWNEEKIYNIGGYWYYEGKNNIKVKNTRNNETVYDFWLVPYHDINFNELHKVNWWKKSY